MQIVCIYVGRVFAEESEIRKNSPHTKKFIDNLNSLAAI